MTLADKIETIVFAFDSRDDRRAEIRAIAARARKLEAALEAAKVLADFIGEYDDDGNFIALPTLTLSDETREDISGSGVLAEQWNAFWAKMDGIWPVAQTLEGTPTP
jgi:hypothetical protein